MPATRVPALARACSPATHATANKARCCAAGLHLQEFLVQLFYGGPLKLGRRLRVLQQLADVLNLSKAHGPAGLFLGDLDAAAPV